jgi:hypothetical protein
LRRVYCWRLALLVSNRRLLTTLIG